MNEQLSSDKYHILWLLLHQTQDAILKAREKDLNQYGISTPESRVLFVIINSGNNVTPANIARLTLREGNSVSTLLKRMEKKGLITRIKDPNRKNMLRVSLTKKGEHAYSQSIKRESIQSIMSVLSVDECQQLELYLKKLRAQAFNQLINEQLFPFPLQTITGPDLTS
jgi:DNA-binding MarR family transcriptional regulator